VSSSVLCKQKYFQLALVWQVDNVLMEARSCFYYRC